MIKERRPDARVAIFSSTFRGQPNPETFGICPWRTELLDGMLGGDLIGFHIQAHCNNFLETRLLARCCASGLGSTSPSIAAITLRRCGHFLSAWHSTVKRRRRAPALSSYEERTWLFRQLGAQEVEYLGFGVDRVDYTKGIPERFRGIERFLDLHPSYRKKLTFVQIGAPSRTHIKRYHDLMTEVEQEAERINQRFATGNWKPIVFLNRHHSHEEIQPYHCAADFCLVTSLHDGMNLVAKESCAARNG